MQLPRWLMIGMLTSSVLALLAAAGWWWVTWPEQTAREFIERVTAGAEKSWKAMMLGDERSRALEAIMIQVVPPRDWSEVEPQSRSLIDLCACRRRFKVLGDQRWEFVAERGWVNGPSLEISHTLLALLEAKKAEEMARKNLELVHHQIMEMLSREQEKPMRSDADSKLKTAGGQ